MKLVFVKNFSRNSFRRAVLTKADHMRPISVFVYLVALLGQVVCANSGLLAQDSTPVGPPMVVLTKLSPPNYPQLARQARIAGDVVLEVGVRNDGSTDSVRLISGHAMLKESAVESARKSTFDCRNCHELTTYLTLTYTFENKDDGDCCNAFDRPPEVLQSESHITIVSPAMCLCDPSVTIKRRRSAKCLYLWKCSRSYE